MLSTEQETVSGLRLIQNNLNRTLAWLGGGETATMMMFSELQPLLLVLKYADPNDTTTASMATL